MISVFVMLTVFSAQPQDGARAFQLDPETWKGWRYEKLEFPLSFAPELKYEGIEELWFAPGMFDPNSPTYFTYAFKIQLTKTAPEKDWLRGFLLTYYTGLCRSVAKEREIELDLSKIAVSVQPTVPPDEHGEGADAATDFCTNADCSFVGVVDMSDPFVTGKPIRLYLQGTVNFGKERQTEIRSTVTTRDLDPRMSILKTLRSLLVGAPRNFYGSQTVPEVEQYRIPPSAGGAKADPAKDTKKPD